MILFPFVPQRLPACNSPWEKCKVRGHRDDTILCDLVQRKVLEISEGRKLEDVQKLLERLDDPDAVKAVSMDMSASFRPAVQLCLPKAQIVVDHVPFFC